MLRQTVTLIVLGFGAMLGAIAVATLLLTGRSLFFYSTSTGDWNTYGAYPYLIEAAISISFTVVSGFASFAFLRLGYITRKAPYIPLPTRLGAYRMARVASLGLAVPAALYGLQGALLLGRMDDKLWGWIFFAAGAVILAMVGISQLILIALGRMEGHRHFGRW